MAAADALGRRVIVAVGVLFLKAKVLACERMSWNSEAGIPPSGNVDIAFC